MKIKEDATIEVAEAVLREVGASDDPILYNGSAYSSGQLAWSLSSQTRLGDISIQYPHPRSATNWINGTFLTYLKSRWQTRIESCVH